MKKCLSYGGGVNSTALMLWLNDHGIEFEAVYADHGCDWPETQDYVKMLQTKGYPITILSTRVEGHESLYDYCLHYRFIPVRFMRWCTGKFKIKPLRCYFKKPSIIYVGIDYGEAHRAKPFEQGGIKHEYPLVNEGIDRRGCEQIITQHGLPVPIRSGCWFCPFQRLSQWRLLRRKHPDLWCKAIQLEKVTNERLAENRQEPIYLRDRPLALSLHTEQEDLFERHKPCQCGL